MKEYGTLSGNVKDRPADIEDFYDSVIYDSVMPPADIDIPYQEPAVEIELEPHNAFEYARETIDEAIIQSDYFIQSALEKDIDLGDTSSMAYIRHLSTITTEYLDDPESKEYFTNIDGGETYHLIKVLGTAPYALRQQQVADHARAQENKSGLEHAKNVLTDFNHAMLKLIEANRGKKVTDLASEIDLTATAFDSNAHATSYNVILDIAYGMRTEDSVMQAIEASSAGYTVRHATKEEDLEGLDFVVTLPSHKDINIDAKSSMQGVRDASKTGEVIGNYAKKSENTFAYCPKTTEEDFIKGTFALSVVAKIRLKRSVLEDLQKMAAS